MRAEPGRAYRILSFVITFSLFVVLSQIHVRTAVVAGCSEYGRHQRDQSQPQLQPPAVEGCTGAPFPVGASKLEDEHFRCIDKLARWIYDQNYWIIIEGHRDSSERIGISLTRANNMREYLVNEKRVDAARIKVRNFSNTCLYNINETWRNGRIDIGIVPAGYEPPDNYTVYPCHKGSSPRLNTTESPA